ncbi:MAG TPA: family 1 glycosylhydrolase [Candidatus Binatia bacterium]|jgi:beta-glucosidase|nr:family 1 glycosylhydrolase [Candidatus Binatia bacterium]
MTMLRFPEGFVWGTATAAHQVEGSNWNNDWWDWEHTPGSPCREPSGDACDHYHRYPQDILLLAELGFKAYRFSLEWSRIEPEEGEFSVAQLDHYRRMCAACHENGLLPIVTYHHFTTPRWVAAKGGWTDPETAERFARFCERTAKHIGDLTSFVCTLNEPNIVATFGHRWGLFPPGLRDHAMRLRANETLIAAHRLAVDVIKSGPGNAPVGMTLAMQEHQAVDGGEQHVADELAVMEDPYLEAARGDDFFGVQTYSRLRFGPNGMVGPEPGVPTTQMGYEFWPQALEFTIRRAWDKTHHVPILVTENGIGTDDDLDRIEYVKQALAGVRACLDHGIDVRGYVYWSLLDNFEWALGYGPTFGLVAVDRTTQHRHPKPSARWLGEIARANALAAH